VVEASLLPRLGIGHRLLIHTCFSHATVVIVMEVIYMRFLIVILILILEVIYMRFLIVSKNRLIATPIMEVIYMRFLIVVMAW